jgi:fructoselysine-6-P-deglycase FrlB-like protein
LNFQVNNTGFFTNAATVGAATTDPNPDDDSISVVASASVSTPPVVMPHLLAGSGGAFQLSITNDAGATIIIQASTNFVVWLPVYTNIAPFTFTNFDTTNFPARFYRAVVEP